MTLGAAGLVANYHVQYHLNGTFAPTADFYLLEKAVAECRRKHVPFHAGNFFTSNAFYHANGDDHMLYAKVGCLGVDQETSTLYMTTAYAGKKALTINTVSDHLWKQVENLKCPRKSARKPAFR